MKYTSGIGVMSGTSLDGLDLAWCQFEESPAGIWNYRVIKADTFPYTDSFRSQLANATEFSALDYCKLNVELGEVIAAHINDFVGSGEKPDFIASHGHTIFHQPNDGLTTQIGSGAVIAARTGITTVCDFRTLDVAHHGQGAPLVPIGDELLFGQYDVCLNLGGFSNLSFRKVDKCIAFDISPCNMALNNLANRAGRPFDKDGDTARSGKLISSMLEELNRLEYYSLPHPKSLGKEWFEHFFLPILDKYASFSPLEDCQHTVSTHIAQQIACALPNTAQKVLITGGGALNRFLIKQLALYCGKKITIPDPLTINYKESIIFAFLGLLRLQHQNNCLKSVTGADVNCCGGCIWHP